MTRALILALALLCAPSAWGAIAFTSAHSAVTVNTGTCTACTLTLGFTSTTGSTLMVAVWRDNGVTVTSVSDSASNSYSLKATHSNSNGYAIDIYAGTQSSGATTVTANMGASTPYTGIAASEYTGVQAFGNTNTNNSATNVTSGSVAVTSQDAADWVVSAVGLDFVEGNVTSATSGTRRVESAGALGHAGTVGIYDSSGSGSLTHSGTFSSDTYSWVGVELCAANPCTGGAPAGPAHSGMTGFWGLRMDPPRPDALPIRREEEAACWPS